MAYLLREGPVWTELVEGDRAVVDKLLCVDDPAAASSAAFGARLTDGLVHFFDRERPLSFPAGLTWRLVQRLRKRGCEVEVVQDPPQRPVAAPPADCLTGKVLRPGQVDALAAALHHRRGVLWEATNFGKGAVIAALVQVLSAGQTHPGLLLAPNKAVLAALRAELAASLPGLRAGVAGDGHRDLRGAVVVATYQTMQQALGRGNRPVDAALLRLVELAPYLLVDEAHLASGAVLQALARTAYNATWRLGFTGTADKGTRRTDDAAVARSRPASVLHRWTVEGALGPVLHRTTNAELVEAGVSARPTVYIVDDRAAFGPDVALSLGPDAPVTVAYNRTFELAVIKDARFLTTVARVCRRLLLAAKPPLVLSHSVEHLRALSEVLAARGVAHKVLVGADSSARRAGVVARYSQQKDFALLCSGWLDMGANIPDIRALVLAGARRSIVELLQRLGRGVRAKAEDNTLTVVDFRPSHCPMLLDQYVDRLAIWRTEGFKIRRIVDVSRLSEIEF